MPLPPFLADKAIKQFIQDNLEADVGKLLLNPPPLIKPIAKQVADQLLSRQKAKKKLPSWYHNIDLFLPPPLSIEQASSESTANFKASLFSGKHLIDLTGGMGIDCLALSNHFETAQYVEQSQTVLEAFKHNAKVFKKNIETHLGDCLSLLKTQSLDPETCFFIDPARRKGGNKVFKLGDCEPNLAEVLQLVKGHRILIKLSPLIDIKSVLKEIKTTSYVYVVSVKNEVKELLILVRRFCCGCLLLLLFRHGRGQW